MGLENFREELEDDKDKDDDSVDEAEFPDAEIIGNYVVKHTRNGYIDLEFDNGTIKGDPTDLGRLFALMFLDYPESDPYNVYDSLPDD